MLEWDPKDCSSQAPRPRDSPGKDAGVGCHFLLRGSFPTPGSNPGLLHWQEDSEARAANDRHTAEHRGLYSGLRGDLDGKELQRRGDA